jgi:hypothetical protein
MFKRIQPLSLFLRDMLRDDRAIGHRPSALRLQKGEPCYSYIRYGVAEGDRILLVLSIEFQGKTHELALKQEIALAFFLPLVV